MIARIVLVVLAWMSTTQAHAGLWQIERVSTGDVIANFQHNPGGLNPGPAPYYEDIHVYIGWLESYLAIPPYAPAYVPNDDSHLSSASADFPVYWRFVVDFAAPLTAAGGDVGVSYAGFSADGTWCRGEPGCLEFGPGSLVARSMADVPVPATFLLILATLPALRRQSSIQRRSVRS